MSLFLFDPEKLSAFESFVKDRSDVDLYILPTTPTNCKSPNLLHADSTLEPQIDRFLQTAIVGLLTSPDGILLKKLRTVKDIS